MNDDLESTRLREPASSSSGDVVAASGSLASGYMVRFDSGEEFIVDRPVVIGREPALTVNESAARLVALDDPSFTVSKSHLRIDPGADGLTVTDRHSMNGVEVVTEDGSSSCEPGHSISVRPGQTVRFGDRTFTLYSLEPTVESQEVTISTSVVQPLIRYVQVVSEGTEAAAQAAPVAEDPPPPARPPEVPTLAHSYIAPPTVTAPPQIWLVGIGMLAIGLLLAYPAVRYGFPLIGSLFSSDELTRAFSALFAFALVALAGLGIAFVGLAVGLLRGSRVSQWLTVLLAIIVAISELAVTAQPSVGTADHTTVIVVTVIAAAVILLITAPESSRAFFGRDSGRPLGVFFGALVGVYLGWVNALDGVLLMLAGGEGTKYVWWGISLAAIGVALISGNRSLKLGSATARGWTTIAFLAAIVINFVLAGQDGNAVTIGNLVLAVVGLSAAGALWFPQASIRHFEQPTRSAPPSGGWRFAIAGLSLVSVVVAIMGFKAASTSNSSNYGFADDSSQTSSYSEPSTPSYDSPTTTGPVVDAAVGTNDWTLTETAEGGYSVALDFSVGIPQRLVSGLTNGRLTAGSACDDIDQQTDAVIPATVTVTNETAGGFSTGAGYNLVFGSQWSGAEAELQYSSGPFCSTDGSIRTTWTTPFSSGQSGVDNLFFVLHNYFTPDHPEGDPSVLANATVTFEQTSGTADDGSTPKSFTPGGPTGPGVQEDLIPLAGAS